MDEHSGFRPAPISDVDIVWACSSLKLPETAFCGPQGDDARQEILKSLETIDIEACPGSGKTTMLVAKLAVLARSWKDARRGICVLSHTNAARREIENRLGNAPEGRRLLSYPHFVGTIHGFVNEFLAIPWLRSLGYPVRVIDSQRCEEHRRRLLRLRQFSALATHVKNKEASGNHNLVSKWCVSSPEFSVQQENGKAPFKDDAGSAATQLRRLARMCADNGYHTYDEMFVWADDLIDRVPAIRDALQERFPILFIDEVQDNSEQQSLILSRLFSGRNSATIRQRFGDANQAIYRSINDTEGASTDRFPIAGIRRDLPNSHRFAQGIANLADPLALDPQGLAGYGPTVNEIQTDTTGKHALFLFDEAEVEHVLPEYAKYLIQIFSPNELRLGCFSAVGAVHRSNENDKVPRHVGHYWRAYDHRMSGADPRPENFLQFVANGLHLRNASGEAHHLVESVAAATLNLARSMNPTADLRDRKRKHRQILELLAPHDDLKRIYLEFLGVFLETPAALTEAEWQTKWSGLVSQVARAIAGTTQAVAVGNFLEWQAVSDAHGHVRTSQKSNNVFLFPKEQPAVQIQLGSIHSVKGATHTATLVLETLFHEHHLEALKPWLLGQRSGDAAEKAKRMISRLKLHYVAMTRPSHLLCLAMKRCSFNDDEARQLKSRSWRVARIGRETTEWL